MKPEVEDSLLTLWKIAYDPTKIEAVRCLPANDDFKLRQYFQMLCASIRTSPRNNALRNPSTADLLPHLNEWASSMTKMAQMWEREIVRKEKPDDDKNDKSKKAWENL